jgi:hypothetical protein
MLKISNGRKICDCFYVTIETNKTWVLIKKAKEWGRTKKAILPKHYNPFFKKNVVEIFI